METGAEGVGTQAGGLALGLGDWRLEAWGLGLGDRGWGIRYWDWRTEDGLGTGAWGLGLVLQLQSPVSQQESIVLQSPVPKYPVPQSQCPVSCL